MTKSKNYFIQLESTYTKKQDSQLHSHRLNQVLLVTKGAFLLEDSHSRKILYKDLIAFIPASIKHKVIAIGERVNFHSIYFNSKNQKFKKDSINILRASILFQELIKSVDTSQNKLRTKLITSLIQDLLNESLKTSELNSISLPRSDDIRVANLINYLDQNFYKKIHLEDLQSVLPLSERQIQRIFSDDLKISISDYIKMKRIQSATLLLNTSKKSILEIAGICGYESISTFYESFKELLGVSPKKFRSSKNIS
jgi:AraC-like DNA-binding protein/mannose-6-phosphate isomerase-like protein (cupin superfamily)